MSRQRDYENGLQQDKKARSILQLQAVQAVKKVGSLGRVVNPLKMSGLESSDSRELGWVSGESVRGTRYIRSKLVRKPPCLTISGGYPNPEGSIQNPKVSPSLCSQCGMKLAFPIAYSLFQRFGYLGAARRNSE